MIAIDNANIHRMEIYAVACGGAQATRRCLFCHLREVFFSLISLVYKRMMKRINE